MTEEYPPYNYKSSSENGKTCGFCVLIVRELLKRIDHPDNIEVVPWSRGYKNTLKKDHMALFSTTRLPEREKLFKWVGPLVEYDEVFFIRKDSDFKINQLEDAKKVNLIGVVKDYAITIYLKGKGFDNLDEIVNPDLNLHKLIAGRFDLWAFGELSGWYLAKKMGVSKKIKVAYNIMKREMYIALSKNTDNAIIHRWQTALDQIKTDGTYKRYYQKYINPNR